MATQPVKVLHVAKSLGPGGTEKVMQLFAMHLDRERFQPAVFSFEDGVRGPALREAGLPTYVGPDLYDRLEFLKPDLVHVHRGGWPEPLLMRPVARARRRGLVRAVVETNVFGRHDPSPHADAVDRVLFVSRFCSRRFGQVNAIDVAMPRYSVLYNPVDTDFFAQACPDRDLSRPRIGRLSRPDPGKWSMLALEIIPLLKERVPGFTYHVLGGTRQAHDYVAERGLADCVTFHDPVSSDRDLADFFNSVSLLAHANDTGESFGLAIAEAMAAGLPVVTHPCPGLKDNAQLELVEHGRTGLVAGNVQEYAEAVAWLLNHPDKARAMGRAGREKAQLEFRVQDLTRRLETLYLEVLEERPTAA